MHSVKKIFINAIRDGYVIVSIAAPLLSIALTIIKFLDLDWAMRDAFRELSYAWALLPITIWFAIAYVRRHAAWEVEREARITAEPFSDEKQSTVNSKMATLPLDARDELYRFIMGKIGVHQLNIYKSYYLEKVGFVKPADRYGPVQFIEQYRPFIEQWFKRNPL